jgi:hypothetical protein
VSDVAALVAARFAAARSDAALLQAALHVEEVSALAYGSARGLDFAPRFAAHERRHAAALETLLQALTVPVREHAGRADLEALVPGLRELGERETLERLEALEQAAISGHQLIGRQLEALDALRTIAEVSGGAAQHLVVIRAALGRAPHTKAFENGAGAIT